MIYWYAPERNFTAFKNPTDNPSYRLRCYLINQYLSGFLKTKIVHNITDIQKDVTSLVLMSFGEEEFEIAKWVKTLGGKVVHDYSENLGGIDILEKTKEICDSIACSSTFLGNIQKEYYPNKVTVIKDPYEDFPVTHNCNFSSDRLKVMWCGMGDNALVPRHLLLPIIADLGMDYIEISNNPDATIVWEAHNWFLYAAQCDVALCPQADWLVPAKSNVKVTTAMSLDLPVIASPLLAYKEIISNEKNGYICQDYDDWRKYLVLLKDKDTRMSLVRKARKSLKNYTVEKIAKQWATLLT